MIVLRRNALQYLVSQLIKSFINKSGSKVPSRGWSVSKYNDITFAAKSEGIGTVVQKLMFNFPNRSSQWCKVDLECCEG
jgi:hypothetical protein